MAYSLSISPNLRGNLPSYHCYESPPVSGLPQRIKRKSTAREKPKARTAAWEACRQSMLNAQDVCFEPSCHSSYSPLYPSLEQVGKAGSFVSLPGACIQELRSHTAKAPCWQQMRIPDAQSLLLFSPTSSRFGAGNETEPK